MFASTGSFRGRAIEWCQTNSNTTTPVAMATKFKTKSPITRFVKDISPRCLRLTGGSQGQAISNDVSRILWAAILVVMHGNKIWDKIGYNSVCILWDVVKQQIYKCKKLTSLKLVVRTMWWYHSTAKIFWVPLDVAMHGAAYGRPMRSPI